MKVPVRWLTDYVAFPWTTEELGHRLTMSGLKIEAIERPGEMWESVYIGAVVRLESHPRSSKPLHVAEVDYGDGIVTVVTGAQNLYVGARAPIVLEGGTIPVGPGGQPLTIVARPMAGITSHGMLCSAVELGLGDDASGILILPEDAPVGERLADFIGEDVLDIETVSNRPDTLSMIGVAREVAALVPTVMEPPDLTRVPENVERIDEESVAVEIRDPDLCPRYSALRVEGVRTAPSPNWLVSRLEAAGLRSINLLVDLTNYVMHEYGQPMHAFDAHSLGGDGIVVRRARPGEIVRTLDGMDRVMPPDSLVIADGERAVAIAGVMGGENSEITDSTTSIILESANFDAPSVRRTAQALGLRTDASSRFEKGLPPEGTVPAIERYVQLLGDITCERLRVARLSDVWPERPQRRTVAMPVRDIRRLLGIDVSIDRAGDILRRLGFEVTEDGDVIRAVVPSWRRVDVKQSADLVEEVGRIIGFDAIPSTLPRRTLQPPVPSAEWYWDGRVRERLRATGLSEAVTHTLTSPTLMRRLLLDEQASEGWEHLVPNAKAPQRGSDDLVPIGLSNPATVDRQVLRLTLLPSLLDVASRNLKHTDEGVAFFEIARTFFPRGEDELAHERRTLAMVMTGRRVARDWQNTPAEPFTFFDVKGAIEAVLAEMHISTWRVEPAQHPSLHPGRSAALNLSHTNVGYLGELHPDIARRFEIGDWPVQVAELDFDALVASASDAAEFRPLPRYPAAYRDIAVVVKRDGRVDQLMELVRREGGDVLEEARIFDVYEGPPLEADERSIAIQMMLRSPQRTLTQDEVEDIVRRIVGSLEHEANAQLRD